MAPKPSYHPPPGGPGGDLRGRLQQQQRPPATPPPSSSPRSMESFANDNITLIASNPTFGSTRGGGSYRTTNLLYSRGPTGPDAKAQRGGSPQPPFYAPPQRTNAALKSSYTPPTTSPGRRAGNTSNNSDSMAALLAGKAPPPANSNKRGPGGAGGRPHPASGPTNLQRGGLGPEAASSPLYGSSSNVSARASSTGALGGVSGLSLHEPTPEAEDSFGRTQFLSSVRQASGLDGSIGGAGDSHRPFALAGGTDGAAATRGGGAFPRHSTSSNVSSSSTARTGSKKAAGAAKTAPVPPQAYDFRVVLSSGKTNGLPITLSVGSGCVQGIRPTMEDEHFAKLNHAMVREQPVSLLAVLDGHCGRRVADLGAKWLPEYFFSHDALGDNNALSLMESILQTDRAIYRQLSKGAGGGVGAVFGGNDYGMNQDISGGSTLITAAIHGRMLYVACLGDARAVLYDGRSTIAMSEDHKPIHPKESRRIAKCGGFVQFGRVCGVLAVSRALGDFEFKVSGANRGAFGGAASNKDRFSTSGELMVSNVADVRQLHLTDDSIFLVLACDGLWDVVSNEDATQFVKDFLLYTPDINDPLVLCGKRPKPNQAIITRALNNCSQKLAEFAVDRGSTDNVSTMVLFFHDVIDSVASFNEAAGLDNMEGADSPSSNRHRAGAGGAHRGEGSHGIYSPSHQGGRRNVAAGGTGHLSPQKGGYNFDASPMKHNTNSPRARQHQQPVLSSPRGGKRRPSEVLSGSFNRGMEYTTPTPTQKGVPNWTGRSRPLW